MFANKCHTCEHVLRQPSSNHVDMPKFSKNSKIEKQAMSFSFKRKSAKNLDTNNKNNSNNVKKKTKMLKRHKYNSKLNKQKMK